MGGTASETVEVDAAQRTYTFTNQPAGEHKISVIPVSEADLDYDERDGVTITPSTCTSTSDPEDCIIKPTDRVEVDGMTQEFAVILHSQFTQVPDPITKAGASAGREAISLAWQIPYTSLFYMGLEGYWPGRTDVHPNARSPIYKYDIRYRRAEVGGIDAGRWKQISVYPWYVGDLTHWNPRRARITGLSDGLPYDVEIRAVNAVGAGAWSRVVSALTVN